MFCTKCGKSGAASDEFCAACGNKFVKTQTSTIPGAPAYHYVPSDTSQHPATKKSGLGFGVASLVIGILAVVLGLADFGLLQSGDYGYILYSEIGFLFLGSVLGIIFGAISTQKSNNIGRWGLGISVLALVLDIALSQFGG